jgi:membrane-associated protein
MQQTGQYIFEFLRHWGYFGLLPLMIIEGPIVTIIAAVLAALGAFNVYVVLVFSIVGDLIGDILTYAVGYKFGMGFVRHVGKYFGITEPLVLKMEKYFKKHGGKTIFLVKSTTGLCWATFTAAGIFKMDFKKFVKYSFYGGIVWSSFLVAMGYFYGYLWREIRNYIQWVGWVIASIALVTIVAIIIFKKWQSRKILEESN